MILSTSKKFENKQSSQIETFHKYFPFYPLWGCSQNISRVEAMKLVLVYCFKVDQHFCLEICS